MKCTLSILHIGVCIAALLCSESHGGETLWQHDPNEPGDWFDPANWTAGIPTGQDGGRIDNQPEWEGAEALYVKEIIIGPGSHLDLNGLNIYYLSSDISPGTLISGGSMIAIPEPTTVGLLTLGAIWIARRRRGR